MSGKIVRCPICGSEVRESEGIIPPRPVCARRDCDGEVWPEVRDPWPDGPTRQEVERCIDTMDHFLGKLYRQHLVDGAPEARFLLAVLGQQLVRDRIMEEMYREALRVATP